MRLFACATGIGNDEIIALANAENPGELGELATAMAGMIDGLEKQTKAIESRAGLAGWNLL